MMRLPSKLWKFLYWPIVWVLIFIPTIIRGDIGLIGGSSEFLSMAFGIIILAWAFTIHVIAGRTLKRLGHSQGHASIWPDRLVTVGIYSCMRHPQHLAFALIPVGIALVLASPIAMISSAWGILAAFLFVLVIEEPEYLKRFGMTYYEYMGKTPSFSLKPSCVIVGLNELKR